MTPELMKRLVYLSRLDRKSPALKVIKLTEETGEVAEAFLASHGYKKKDKSVRDLIEECCDAATTALSIPFKMGFDEELVLEVFKEKLDKWEEKILELNRIQDLNDLEK